MTAQQSDRISPSPHAHDLLKQLRHKLRHFAVMDNQGNWIGEVADVILGDQHQPTIVLAQGDHRQALITGTLVQKVDSKTRQLMVGLSPQEVSQLSEYHTPEMPPTQPLPVDMTNEEEEPIRLLEERLVVDRTRHKVGEVIVRKEIETRMVQVPVRREKLIVEQVGSEHRPLAEIDLGEGEITGVEWAELDESMTVQAEFTSLRTASQVLDAIARQPESGCRKVRIELVLDNPQLQGTYQNWLQHYSENGSI
ncbi:MAG: DUF2382 domain-containing protein [Leptolyngbyaceae cyanobacterium bins.59]|nr:DUF2382 domain-containing protein [Leptolyngbyaceae cyanobacterium bins.59]